MMLFLVVTNFILVIFGRSLTGFIFIFHLFYIFLFQSYTVPFFLYISILSSFYLWQGHLSGSDVMVQVFNDGMISKFRWVKDE